MKKSTKGWLITATALVFAGAVIFGGVMMGLRWDFTKLSTVPYETKEYEITEEFRGISVVAKTALVEIVPSDDGKISVTCREQKSLAHRVSVKDGTLVIQVEDSRKWYEYIGIHSGSPKITISLPQGEYGALSVATSTGAVTIPEGYRFSQAEITVSTGAVSFRADCDGLGKIKTSTGSIRLSSISCGSLNLSASTGSVSLSQVQCAGELSLRVTTGDAELDRVECQKLTSSGSTGDLTLKNVLAADRIYLERSTGDITFDRCDGAEIFVTTDTGHVTGSLCSEKIFFPKTDTGRISVPQTTSGGRCEISTDTGSIHLEIVKN